MSAKTVSVKRAVILRAAKLLDQHTKSIFDGCKGADGSAFVCGDCPAGNDVCEREHRVRAATVKALREAA